MSLEIIWSKKADKKFDKINDYLLLNWGDNPTKVFIKKGLNIILFFLIANQLFSQEKDYIKYHNDIIEAEKNIFIDNDSIKGLKKFEDIFSQYDFVFIDDCIEAFQIALVFNQDSFAYKFIEKAIKTGFQPVMLKYLDTGYSWSDNSGYVKRPDVTIYEDFIVINKAKLDSLTSIYYPKYIDKIKENKNLIKLILTRHIIEQLYKQNEKKITYFNNYPKTFNEISEENLLLIFHFFKNNELLGERNLSIYSDKIMLDIGLPTIKELADSIISKFKFNSTLNRVPYVTDVDYFEINPVFNILYHNPQSFDKLKPFAEKAISLGYLHPREYALLLRGSKKPLSSQIKYKKLGLEKLSEMPDNTKEINIERKKMYLPPFEVDYFKKKFQNYHNVQLFFGFLHLSK